LYAALVCLLYDQHFGSDSRNCHHDHIADANMDIDDDVSPPRCSTRLANATAKNNNFLLTWSATAAANNNNLFH
jgi:hypothetical protein